MAATDERAIHEFPTGTIDENSLLIMDRPTSTPGEYETEKFAIANLGLKLLGGIDFPSNLDTDEQDIFGAINEVNAKAMNISDEYDETASYTKGDYCIYQNVAYRCIKASGTTTGTFVAADWTQIKVLSEVKANTEEIGLKQNATDNTLTTTDKTIVGAINELNTAMSGTDITADVTLNSDISLVQGQIYRIGSLITINAVLKANQSIPNNATIWSGLPRAKGNYRFAKGTSDGVYYANEWTGGGLFIDNNSSNFGNFTLVPANKHIFVNCSYITSE